MRYTLFLLLLTGLLGSHCFAQVAAARNAIRSRIQILVDSIAEENIVRCNSLEESGEVPTQWERFKRLEKGSTIDELVKLTEHNNAVVRYYAFYALALRKENDIFPILIRHLKDTATIETFCGCIKSTDVLADRIITIITTRYADANAYKLTALQRSVLDSILLFDKWIKLQTKDEILKDMKLDLKYYSRIREIALTDYTSISMFILAKYRNNNDIAVIQQAFRNMKSEYYAIKAATVFPDSSFYPFLVKIFERELQSEYYNYRTLKVLFAALSKYPSNTTCKLFEKAISTKDDYRNRTSGKCILIAIKKYPNKIFEPFLSKIKLDEYDLQEVNMELEYGF